MKPEEERELADRIEINLELDWISFCAVAQVPIDSGPLRRLWGLAYRKGAVRGLGTAGAIIETARAQPDP